MASLLALAALAPAVPAAAAGPSLTLLHQGPVAVLSPRGRSTVTVTVATPKGAETLRFSLFPRLITRGAIDTLVAGTRPTGSPISTGVASVGCHATTTMRLSVAVGPVGPTTGPCGGLQPRLRLTCARLTCDGVYPLGLTLVRGGTSTTEWSLLAVQATPVTHPLRLSWIEELNGGTWREATRSIAVLDAIGRLNNLPLTLGADYRSLESASASTGPVGAAWRTALGHALASPLHRAINSPPATIDFTGLARAGLTTEVARQLSLGPNLLRQITGRYSDGPVLLSGVVTPAGLAAVAHAGGTNVVLPESDLASPPSRTLAWGAPFGVTGAPGVVALATDDPLASLATDGAIDPGRRAALVLGTLAFLHFEEPNAPAARGVVVVVPVQQTVIPFLDDLASGLANNPFVSPGGLVPSFAADLVATNGAPATRALAPVTIRPWSSSNVATLGALIGQVNSFAGSITSGRVATALRVEAALTEQVGSSSSRTQALSSLAADLDGQLAQFSVDPSAITLTGPGTQLPITLHSRATYPVTAVVHLASNQLSFPKGATSAITLTSPTTSLRVPIANARGSSLTLQVVVTTADQQLVLARAAIQVRVAGTSVVGYLLTIASLVVLAAWWWRTTRRRRTGKHAR